jgi:hypothetical protein
MAVTVNRWVKSRRAERHKAMAEDITDDSETCELQNPAPVTVTPLLLLKIQTDGLIPPATALKAAA